jgi:hypothetical protein
MAKEVGLRGRMDIAQFNKNVQSFVQSINLMNREVSRVAKESAAGAAEAGKAANLLGVNFRRYSGIPKFTNYIRGNSRTRLCETMGYPSFASIDANYRKSARTSWMGA